MTNVNLATNTGTNDIVVQSTCAYCGVGCGVDITVSSNQPSSLSGTPEHPANYGRLCIKGQNLLETIDTTGRLLSPIVNGEEVEWSKAIDVVASRFKQTIDKYGPDSVAFYVSGQMLTEDYYVANKLMKGFIGSGNIDTNSRLCMSSAVSAYKRAFGEDIVPCSYTDLENTDLLVLIGSNAAWTHPVLFQRIERARQINPDFKLVVIDPRASATTVSADMHLSIKPGTDAALYNGLLRFLKDNAGLDISFIKSSTEGFDACFAECIDWTIEKTADYCQLPVDELSQFYQQFVESDKVVSMYSMGINQSTSGVDKCNAIINVHLASGKIGRQGCGPFSITGQPNAMGGREVGGLANQLTAHLDIDNRSHQSLVKEFWQSPTIATKQGAKAVELFEQIKQGSIKAVWIMATNPLVSLPNNHKIRQAMEACEFVVVSDCVSKNDTLKYADVKLPATPWIEKNGTVTNSERRISRQRSVTQPAGQAKHDWQIISLVAQAMGYKGFDYQHPYQIFTEFAALSGFKNEASTKRVFDISGLSSLSKQQYNQLKPIQWPVNKHHASGCQHLFSDGQFPTDSTKAKFVAIKPKTPEQKTDSHFPFVLNSGRYRDQWHTMTRTGKAAKLQQHLTKPYLAINPVDAATKGIEDESLVLVRSKTGEVVVPAKISSEQSPGNCFLPIHWNNQFASNATVSALFQDVVDPISGQPELKYSGIAVSKKTFSQYIDIFIVKPIEVKGDYWLKTKTSFGWHYQLALDKRILADEWSSILDLNGEWVSLIGTGPEQFICIESNQLKCVVFTSEETFRQPSWVTNYFEQSELKLADIQILLAGKAPSPELLSRKVCSCYSVSEYSIEQALNEGCNSLDALGKKLKCGTNCGSCKPEIQLLIEQHKTTQALEIPIKELAVG